MSSNSSKSPSSVVTRLFSLLPAGWMLLVLLLFVAIRILGSRLIQSLHLFGKAY